MENRILVVDDEKEVRDFLKKALTKVGGFQVELAENGEEALRKIEQDQFALILTDLQMPNMDGLQLIDKIVKSKPDILIVLMTGYATIDSALEGLKRGASDYLAKPINLEEAILRLRKVLEERQRFVNLRDYADHTEKANLELKKLDLMKSEFVSIASHELRTPLASIKNAVQLILKGKTGEINETQAKFLSMAERNINRLTNILNDILDLSRIESGKMVMTFEELNLAGPIEFILSSFKPQAEAKSIRLKMEVSKEFPSVYGNREKVEQILTNLIGNAIKFTPEGGEVSVSAKPCDAEGYNVAISVRDTGIGISQDQLEKIFEKFYQVEGSLHRSAGGTGLGLAITKGLVEAHRGKIWAESQVGKGSTVTFALPTLKGEGRKPYLRFILNREFERAVKNHTPLTLVLLEVADPRVKSPHPFLGQLEEKMKRILYRKADIVVRSEKGKILAALCEADSKGGKVIHRRIEEEIQKNSIHDWNPPPLIKVGAATYPEEALSKRELFRRAKEHLRG